MVTGQGAGIRSTPHSFGSSQAADEISFCSLKKLRQLADIRRDPPRLVAGVLEAIQRAENARTTG
jgi:hypothetical protein